MDFSSIKSLTIPEGAVKKIESNGVLLWEEHASYTNQVPISIDTDGTIFNGKGWIRATRLSSSGATKTSNYASTTGFIPASSAAVIRIAETSWLDGAASQCYVCTYDSEFNFISAVNNAGAYGGGSVGSDENGHAMVTLLNNDAIAYVRVSANVVDKDAGVSTLDDITDGPGSYMIVTVNEEIAA